MKKLISLSVLFVFGVMNFVVFGVGGGVAWAEGECPEGYTWEESGDPGSGICKPDSIGNANTCVEGVRVNEVCVNTVCSNSGGTVAADGTCSCFDGAELDEESQRCDCSESKPNLVYEEEKGSMCMTDEELVNYNNSKCAETFGKGFVYDKASYNCYNPDVSSGSLIPAPSEDFDYSECEALFNYSTTHLVGNDSLKSIVKSGVAIGIGDPKIGAESVSPLDILGCAVMTGNVSFWMVPFYIKYLIQFALSIAGLIAVIGIIIGGYYYFFGGLSDDKDKGKRSIIYGIAGFVLAILSWALVNIVISALTR